MSADLTKEVEAEVSSTGSHHSNQSSGEFIEAVAPAEDDTVEEEEEALQSPDNKSYKEVTLYWDGPFSHQLLLFASHNRFKEGVEMQGSAEEGYSCTVLAPAGQDLVYRFQVDGEFQCSGDAPTMAMDGDEFNWVHVDSEEEAQQGEAKKLSAPDTPPGYHKRASSKLVWDNQRSTLLIDATKSPNKNEADSPNEEQDEGEEDGEDEGEEENDNESGSTSGLSRTKRKNLRHRQKAKEERSLFQSLNSSSPMRARSTSNAAGGLNSGHVHTLIHEINRLKLHSMQKENEWKEAWVAHEIQSFQQREAERNAMKAQMNEERARWLAKLKEYTADLKTVRDENMDLKNKLAAQANSKKLESSSKKRVEKFQTLQRNMLGEEMQIWIQERNKLQQQVDAIKAEKEEADKQVEELTTKLQAANTQLSTVQVELQSKEREIATMQEEKKQLSNQLAATSADSNEAVNQLKAELKAAHDKVNEEVRAANQVRDQVERLQAQVNNLQSELATKTKEAEQHKAAKDAQAAQTQANMDSLKRELASAEQKMLATQEENYSQKDEIEVLRTAKEEVEMKLDNHLNLKEELVKDYEKQLAQARGQVAESATQILSLNSGIKTLRQQVSSLAELQLSNTRDYMHQLAEAQTFLVDSLQVQSTLLERTMRKYKKEMSERRKLHNVVQELRGNIRVYCRARPMSEAELKEGRTLSVLVSPPDEAGEASGELTLETSKGPRPYQFDAVFGPDSTQQEVFSNIVSLVTSVMDGYSCCLFAYGQTGAGKTHSMQGNPSNPGMNLLSLSELFRLREERKDDVEYEISVSFYEVYCEQIFDLLDTNRDKELKIRQGSTGVYVDNLVTKPVESQEDVLKLMEEGNKNRTVGSTSMNAHSSRSHSILSVQVRGHSSTLGMQLRGTLHLIDLAGSERLARSQATGDRLKEATAINSSLSALGNCIEALQKKSAHVPYRNSKLTYILQNSLGGNAKTLMICCISPSSDDVEETLCSLQFASRVRSVELGSASKNVSSISEKKEEAAAPKEVPSTPRAKASASASASATKTSAVKKPLVGSAVKKPLAGATPLKKAAAK